MSQTIRLMIVDDYPLFRECLASVLTERERFRVLDVVESRQDALHKIKEHQPDVVLVDQNLPNQMALELTRRITRHYSHVRVLILGLTETEEEILTYVEAGASGYVLKEASIDDLQVAIDLVVRGETVCSPRVVHSMFSRLAELARQSEEIESLALTPREMEILQLVAEGLSNKQIADRLFLSLHTVKRHVHNILEKLQVQHRLEAVEYAYKKRWLRK